MNKHLFSNEKSLSDKLRKASERIFNEIQEMNASDLQNEKIDFQVNRLISRNRFAVPVLEEKGIQSEIEDVNLEVPSNFQRGTVKVKGTKVTIRIPYKGNGELFQYRPSAFNMNPPVADVSESDISLTYTLKPGEDIKKVKEHYPTVLANIKWYLTNVENEVSIFNNRLESDIMSAVEKRKNKFAKDQKMRDELGF